MNIRRTLPSLAAGIGIGVVVTAAVFNSQAIAGFLSGLFSLESKVSLSDIRMFDAAKDPKTLSRVLKSVGTEQAMAKLLDESGGGATIDCHQEAHEIGRAAYGIFGEKVFAECNASCHSGCYHGAMESVLHSEGLSDLVSVAERICDTFDTRFGVYECYHGIGHGVLAFRNYDLPKAIEDCNTLPGEKASFCEGGMFMENVVTGQGSGAKRGAHATEWVNREDPHFPCNAVEAMSPTTLWNCYMMQTSWMLTINGYDFDKVAPLCAGAPESMVATCYQSYGRDAAGHTLRDPARIIELCRKIPAKHFDVCISGGVQVIIDFWGADVGDRDDALCMMLEEPHRAACMDVVNRRAADFAAEGS